MSRFGAPGMECKVYVGNLSDKGNVRELETAFGHFGDLRNVWVARHPPGFAFIEFYEKHDAEDAVRELHSTYICGRRVEVEHATGEKNRNRGGGGGGGGGGGRYPLRRSYNDDKCYECGARGHFARECSYNRPRRRSRSRSYDRYNSSSSYSRRYRSNSRSRSRSRSKSYHSPGRK